MAKQGIITEEVCIVATGQGTAASAAEGIPSMAIQVVASIVVEGFSLGWEERSRFGAAEGATAAAGVVERGFGRGWEERNRFVVAEGATAEEVAEGASGPTEEAHIQSMASLASTAATAMVGTVAVVGVGKY